jgi:cytochrome c553
MHRVRLPALASLLLLASLAGLSLAGSGLAGSAAAQSSVEALSGPPGASSCTGCHAPRKVADSVIPHIAGRSANDIAKAMREYRSGAWPSSIMGRITKGFDDRQIDALSAWFSSQPE